MSSASLMGGWRGDHGPAAGAESGWGGRGGGGCVTPWAAGVYEKIKAFEIDRPGDAFPFSARLARENGWSRGYALRVVEEYRRFICLMATAPHPVTPSEAVDQAWHLHMTYTRSYWEGLCKQVVGRPLHHDPTRGGAEEDSKFTDWYTRTLETYQRVFGETPPADIWPSPAQRFAPSTMQWVDLTQYRLVKRRSGRGLMWLGFGGAAAAVAGCGRIAFPVSDVWIFVAIVVFFCIVTLLLRVFRGKGGGGSGGSGCGGASGCGASGCGSGGCGSSGCGGGGCGGGD